MCSDITLWFLSCSFLMKNDVSHILLFFYAICVTSLVTCLMMSFVHFPIGLLDLLYWVLKSLYILDTILWPDTLFAKPFSHSVACFYNPLVGSVTEQMFLILIKSSNKFSFHGLYFWLLKKKTQKTKLSIFYLIVGVSFILRIWVLCWT